MFHIILTGLVAGLASALLFATIIAGSPLTIILFYAAPLPLMIAGIGWSHRAALVGALGASVFLAAVLAPLSALFFLICVGTPAWILSYLALLGRRDGDNVVEWFPAGNIVMAAALIAASLGVLGVITMGPSPEAFHQSIRSGIEIMLRDELGLPGSQPLSLPDVNDTTAFIDLLADLIPPIVVVFLTLTLLLNLWLACRAVQQSGRFPRPWPAFETLQLPRSAAPALISTMLVSMVPGFIGLVVEFFAATMLLAFTILGFAVIHALSRGNQARPLILGGVYLMTFAMGWPLVVVAGLGLAEQLFAIRNRVAARRGSSSPGA